MLFSIARRVTKRWRALTGPSIRIVCRDSSRPDRTGTGRPPCGTIMPTDRFFPASYAHFETGVKIMNRSRWQSAMRTLVGLTCAGTMILIGCGGSKSSGLAERQRALTYGYGPDPKGSAVYQPDVVLIQGGPAAIRSASANGLVWTIDGNAGGARELRVGKIMFATSRAVGRVARIEPVGDDFAVTLAPVQLTEVVRDANIKADVDINPESVVYQSVPDLPGMLSTPPDRSDAGDVIHDLSAPAPPMSGSPLLRPLWSPYAPEAALAPPIELISTAGTAVPDKLPFPVAFKEPLKVTVGDWEIEPSFVTKTAGTAKPGGTRSSIIRLKIQRVISRQNIGGDSTTGLKLGIDVSLFTQNFHLAMATPISNGKVGQARFVLEGLDELDLSFWGGVEQGLQDNQKVRIEVPVELNIPIEPSPATAGIPMTIQVRIKLIIETAFVGKNSSMHATGKYKLAGPLGFVGGTILVPGFSVIKPMMSQLDGVAIGGFGVIFAWETRFMDGLGTPAAMAGPYGKLTNSVGVAMGSVLSYMLGPICRGVTIKIDAAAGIGVQISSTAAQTIQKLLGKSVRLNAEYEASTTVINRSLIWPDTPLCHVH